MLKITAFQREVRLLLTRATSDLDYVCSQRSGLLLLCLTAEATLSQERQHFLSHPHRRALERRQVFSTPRRLKSKECREENTEQNRTSGLLQQNGELGSVRHN